MRSPKFKYTLSELQRCIDPEIIKTVWKKKIGGQLRDQIIMDLVEYRDYRTRIDALAHDICTDIASGEYQTLPTKHYLVEKSRGLCRQLTIASPRDLIVLQCLSNRLYSEIKASQPTDKAYFEPGKGEFNKGRVLIRPDEYGSYSSWKRFQQAIFDFSKERDYVVVTDVANFYDFINLAHLRNIVSTVCRVSESVIDFLIFVLDSLAWHPDFMPTTGVGLPQMEVEAPRVLANAMLFELDRVAHDQAYGDYVRFMDDIDIGVDTLPDAKRVVRDIDLTLQSRQLRLNSSKTKILRTADDEAAKHFCIRENRILDYAARFLESDKSNSRRSVSKVLKKLYAKWRGGPKFEKSRFLEGNGEKVFKYLVALSKRVGPIVSAEDALWLIQSAPALRATCFSVLASKHNPVEELRRLSELFSTGWFVDDAAYLLMAKFLCHARFSRSAATTREIADLADNFAASGEYFETYAALLIASKYLPPLRILSLVKKAAPLWRNDLWMARVVAALTPAIARSPQVLGEFYLFCSRLENREWACVYDHMFGLMTDPKAFEAEMAYMKHPNASYPYGIYHPKVMTILAIRRNRAAKQQIAAILKAHPALLQDEYYSHHFKEQVSRTMPSRLMENAVPTITQ